MPHPILELEDRLNWDELLRRSYVAPLPPGVEPGAITPLGIPEIAIFANQPILMVGIKSDTAKPSWWLGAHVTMILNILPSIVTEFTASTHFITRKVRLNYLNILIFPKVNPTPYTISIKIPKWIKQAYVEVWEYSGANTDTTEALINTYAEMLHRMEGKIDNLRLG